MRLSEAIRLGATMKPQGFGARYSQGNSRTCAIGAALDAIGLYLPGGSTPWHPFLEMRKGSCPACQKWRGDLGVVIVHLNDDHKWTRERIADFVELHEIDRLVGKEEQCHESERIITTSASVTETNAASILS